MQRILPSDLPQKTGRISSGERPVSKRTTPFLEKPGERLRQWLQYVVRVVSIEDEEGQLYKVKRRFWDKSASTWLTYGREYDLDSSELDMTLGVDDKIVAYWDSLREMFVPTGGTEESGPSSAIEFKLTEVLTTIMAEVQVERTSFYDGTDPGQYLTILNPSDQDGGFVFEGAIGKAGWALYNANYVWGGGETGAYVIWNLNC